MKTPFPELEIIGCVSLLTAEAGELSFPRETTGMTGGMYLLAGARTGGRGTIPACIFLPLRRHTLT
tara:strand:+ start:802 stop:999 length:198 start_codon:yes stop_codon:yes gene_type:complete